MISIIKIIKVNLLLEVLIVTLLEPLEDITSCLHLDFLVCENGSIKVMRKSEHDISFRASFVRNLEPSEVYLKIIP